MNCISGMLFGVQRRLLVLPVLTAVAVSLVGCAPSAEAQDKKACQDWSQALVGFTQSGGDEAAAQSTASVMTSKVIPEASPQLAPDMRVIAKLVERYAQTSTDEEIAASERLGARCKAVGAPLNAND